MFKKIIDVLLYPYTFYKEKQRVKKRLEELRKRDPFIYK
jgi:hypothetical protein